jgi:hypothetical protein
LILQLQLQRCRKLEHFSKYNKNIQLSKRARLTVALQIEVVRLGPGANPTTLSYSASVVDFYNTTGSPACFKNNHSTLKNTRAFLAL